MTPTEQIAALREALKTLNGVRDAWTNLTTHQTQLDADGCMVGVSRQAVDETVDAILKATDILLAATAPTADAPQPTPVGTEEKSDAEHFVEFVSRHSHPCRRDSLTDKEFRSIVEYHPTVRDFLADAGLRFASEGSVTIAEIAAEIEKQPWAIDQYGSTERVPHNAATQMAASIQALYYTGSTQVPIHAAQGEVEAVGQVFWNWFHSRHGGPYEGAVGTMARADTDACAQAAIAAHYAWLAEQGMVVLPRRLSVLAIRALNGGNPMTYETERVLRARFEKMITAHEAEEAK